MMAGAITLTVRTQDNLVITAAINIRDGKQYSEFSIEPFFPAIETNEKPKHAFDINNTADPTFTKIDDMMTNRLKGDLSLIKTGLTSMGIKILESE